jgi:hypothetical protein
MDERTKKLVETYNTQGPLSTGQIGDVIATTPANTAITASSLQGVTPMKLTNPEPLTGPDGILGSVEASSQTFSEEQKQKTQQSQEIAQLKAKTDSSKQSLMQKWGLSKGETQQTDEAYAQTVDPLETELKGINQDIFEEQQSLRRRIESLDKTPGTIEQKAQREYDLKKDSSRLQADLYVKQLGIQGRYDSAKQIADRKIAVELEKDKRDLEILKFDYEENKELFTKEEQRQFETAQADRERALNAKEAKMKTFEDTRIALLKSANEQEAPLNVKTAIANAKTTEEAIQAAGQYAGDILDRQIKQAQLAKLRTDAAKAVSELSKPAPGDSVTAQAQAQGNINLISELVNDKNIRSAVGPTWLGRFVGRGYDSATGGRQNFVAGIEQLTSQLSLDSLIQAKAKGATFGALSEGELRLLNNSATKLSKWAIKDSNGNVSGYNAGEKDFKGELDRINNFAKLDYLYKGGAPEDIGAEVKEDGAILTKDSFGRVIQLYP